MLPPTGTVGSSCIILITRLALDMIVCWSLQLPREAGGASSSSCRSGGSSSSCGCRLRFSTTGCCWCGATPGTCAIPPLLLPLLLLAFPRRIIMPVYILLPRISCACVLYACRKASEPFPTTHTISPVIESKRYHLSGPPREWSMYVVCPVVVMTMPSPGLTSRERTLSSPLTMQSVHSPIPFSISSCGHGRETGVQGVRRGLFVQH